MKIWTSTCIFGTYHIRANADTMGLNSNLSLNLHIYSVCIVVQVLISVQALVFYLAQLTCQKRFDCRNAILGSSAILLGTSYS